MFVIKHTQLDALRLKKEEEFVSLMIEYVRKVYESEESEVLLQKKISELIEIARSYGIETSQNQRIFIDLFYKFPEGISLPIPSWIHEELDWPNRTESDKVMLVYKELYKKELLNN